MLKKVDGACFADLIKGGVEYLNKHKKEINDLNVFPVPDGDTGTNMVMTLKYGLEAIKNSPTSLSDSAKAFASSAVFGARGNSGVIVSQFFKGVSEAFIGFAQADTELLCAALKNGCKYAYASVAQPVEGTMLTVIKDASIAVEKAMPLNSIEEVIDAFLCEAKISLQNTPNLLPVLKKANVVDSGGNGIVYIFEGIKKVLNGESIEAEDEVAISEFLDLSCFNKDTHFEYGYCIEGLIQLNTDALLFDLNEFKNKLSEIGNSVVASVENDKVKLHVHSKVLSDVMACCQKHGEFLTIKIENMTVQNVQKAQRMQEAPKFLYSDEREIGDFSVVAVATNGVMQQKFFEMGADVIICSNVAPSSQDFLDAFKHANAKKILVFPNSPNSILASMQAGSLYKDAKVTVLNCRSIAECYSTLPIIDYEGSIEDAVSLANETLSNVYQLAVYHATKDKTYGSTHLHKDDYFVLSGNKIIGVSRTLEDVTVNTVKNVLSKNDYSVLTIFYGRYTADEYIEELAEKITNLGFEVEVSLVSTFETLYDLTLTFE